MGGSGLRGGVGSVFAADLGTSGHVLHDGAARARSRCRFALTLTHFLPDLLR